MLQATQVPAEIMRKWQGIVDLLADIVRVPSALIMRVEPPNIKVLIASESHGNPYEPDEEASLNTGLYCETVMSTRRPLLVPDALQDEDWKSNPDIKLGMISYLGVPISWPDGEIFGTICVLDRESNGYSDLYLKLLLQWRDVLQADLTSIATSEQRFRIMQTELTHANRLATLGQLTASITHEVKQPLAAALLNTQAALRFLDHQPPDVERGKTAMDRAVRDCMRAAEVVERTRALVQKEPVRKDSVEINEAISEVIGLTHNEVLKNGVEVQTQLAEGLPVNSRQPRPASTGDAEFDRECGRGDEPDERQPPRIADQHEGSSRLCSRRGARLRPRPGRGRDRAGLRGILYDEVERPGDGAVDLPFDHRGSRRTIVGGRKRAERCGVSIHGSVFSANAPAGDSLRLCDPALAPRASRAGRPAAIIKNVSSKNKDSLKATTRGLRHPPG